MVFRKLLLFTSFLILPVEILLSQITVNNSLTPQQLVQNILLGQGVQVSNITFSGDPLQIGSFSGNSSIGLTNGLILSSGDAQIAIGPNNQGGATLPVTPSGSGSDPDLTAIANAATNDAAVLEFDFIPVGDTLSFRYVFASEEYLEYVNAGYNDAFGFFVSGPGLNGPYTNNAVNIALLPGSATPVTIDNVNDVSNSAYYVDNGNGSNAPYNSNNYYVQFDGFTAVLDALLTVQCGETYHIKLAIADAGDSALDSGVFLEGGSFTSNGIIVSVVTATGDSTVVEGCADAVFTFTRNDTIEDATIYYQIGGNAENGIDYSLIPDSVTILQGQTTTSLTITPLADTLIEGTDTLTITIFNISECGDTLIEQASLYILEDYTLTITAADETISCPGESVALSAFASGGVPPYHFVWSNGDSNATTYVSPLATDTFFVTVTDSCFFSPTIDTVVVTLQVIPVLLSVSNDTVLYCPDDTVLLSASASGGSGSGYQYEWNTGAFSSSIIVNPAGDTVFYVTATDACGVDSVSDSILVTFSIPELNLSVSNDTNTVCPGAPVILSASGSSGTSPYSFTWSNGDSGDSITVNPISDSTFFVTMTDACGAPPVFDSIKVTLDIPQLILSVGNDTTTICPGAPVVISASGSNGTAPYSFNWSNGNSGDSITVNPTTDSTFYVTLTDACGAAPVFDSIKVFISIPQLVLTMGNDTVSNCIGASVNLSANGSNGATPYSLNWSNGSTGSYITVNPTSDSTFYVTLTDACGAAPVSDSIKITLAIAPIDLSVSNDVTVSCPGDSASLSAVVSGGATPFSYSWNTGATSSSIVVNPTQNTQYYITVTNTCGALADSDSVMVNVQTYNPMVTNLSDDTTINCSGDITNLVTSVTGGASPYTYVWSNSAVSNSITVAPNSTTEYFLTISDKCGTDTLDSVTVLVPVYPALAPVANDTFLKCPNDSEFVYVVISGGTIGNYYFLWNNGSTNDSIYVSSGTSTNFVVTVTDGCGATASDTATLTVPVFSPVQVVASDYDTICNGDTITLEATASGGNGIYSFSWFGNGSINGTPPAAPTSVPLASGLYTVTATDQCGNNNFDETFIQVDECNILIPNIFTPNGDNFNQYFFIPNLEKFPNSEIKIFNRWGRRVYENPDYKNDWTGKGLSDGVYFYVLTLSNGVKHSGSITIVR